jgi:hypothetical protein
MATAKSEQALHDFFLESPVWVGLVSFLFMFILNFSCLDNPPYWDDILGLHNQAAWLAKNNFNLSKLWQPGQEYLAGGSNIYKFGMMPYFYGILYALFSPKTVHVLGHLFNMGCLALAFGVSYSLLLKFKINNYAAFLWCIAVICEPLMSGRVVALGQECPLVCATLISIYFLFNKKYSLGIFFIFIAMLCKMTAGVLATAFTLWLILDICLDKENRKERFKKYYPYLIAMIILVCFFLFDTFGAKSELLKFSDNIFIRFFFILKHHFLNLLIVQFIVLCVIGLLAIYKIIVLIKHKKLFNLPEKDKFSLFLLILCGGFWMSYGLCALPLPRYSAFIVFPMYIFVAINAQFRAKYLNVLPALILLIIGVININGAFYPRLRVWQLRSGDNLERSREFVDDLWANQGACKFLETKCFNRPIVAKWPYVQMLTVPEMGYVSKSLPNVYAACLPIKYAKVKAYKVGMKMPQNTLYVFVNNSFSIWKQFGPSLFPAQGENCKIIFANQVRGGRLIIYEKESK